MASSSLFSKILNRIPKPFTPTNPTTEAIFTRRTCHSKAKPKPKKRDNLFTRIIPLGGPDISLTPVLDQWVNDGKKVNGYLLTTIIKGLRARKRYTHALEVSEWMSCKGLCTFSSSDHALQLDLIGNVHGVESAETYFNNLDDQDKDDKTYGALLHCYAKVGLVDKSLSHLQKMKELGFAFSPLVYKDLMSLYTNTGHLDKVPEVLLEMKKNGVSPDNFSYRICLNSYGARSDIHNVEKIMEEMESQPHISMDWNTYAAMANVYIKAGSGDKALVYLKKCEEKVDKDAFGYNYLISLYASLGNKDEVMRLWGLSKAKCKNQKNRDYITMLGSLVKLDDLEEAQKLLDEWESACYFYDFRVPNVLLIGYSQKGLIEKAEALLLSILEKGKTPTPNSWAIIAEGYMDKQNMEKAFQCMKEALTVQAENKGWRPKSQLISSILNWLGDNVNAEEVDAFVKLLKTKVPGSREMYHALLGLYQRSKKK